MEKGLICIILAVLVAFSACKKEGIEESDEYIEGWTEVLGIKGTDTSSTGYMHAREQSLVLDEDTQLKAELVGWLASPGGNADYIIQVTNKTNCQMILRWNWNNLNPVVSIEPNDATSGTPQAQVMQPNQVKIFHFIARAVPGTIFVKSEKSNSTCEPSSQLKIEITTSILPIKYTNKTTSRVGNQMVVQWSTESPGDVDKFLIMWTPTGKKEDEVLKTTITSNPSQKKYNAVFPAVKKIK